MTTNKKSQSDHVYPEKFNRQRKERPSSGRIERPTLPRYDPKKDSACISACEKIRALMPMEAKATLSQANELNRLYDEGDIK